MTEIKIGVTEYEAKPEYIKFTKEIIFTKEAPKAMGRSCGASWTSKHRIVMNMKCSEERLRIDFCHELLHEFIKVPDGRNHTETKHWAIHDIAKKLVCYNEAI